MSIYARYKKDQDGFRRLVELLETTPMKRRLELIERGMKEDAHYTKAAVEYVITFQDILTLPVMELTEVIAAMKPKNVAYCVLKEEESVKARFLACVQKTRILDVHSYSDANPSPAEAGQAKKEAITEARKLEKKGVLSLKRIPKNFNSKEHAKAKTGKSRDETMPDPFAGGKDLFGDNLFGAADDDDDPLLIIGKKKAG